MKGEEQTISPLTLRQKCFITFLNLFEFFLLALMLTTAFCFGGYPNICY